LNNKNLPDRDAEPGPLHRDDFLSKMKISTSQIRKIFKTNQVGFMTRKIFLALSLLNLKNPLAAVFSAGWFIKIRRLVRKQALIEMVLLCLLLFPFVFISIVLSWGLWSGLQLLIFFMALIFVYYIYSSIVEPIVFLFIQKKIHEIIS
jgi:hypothetical protein